MLRISRNDRKFLRLERPTLTQAEILERADLQEYICNSPNEFFAELGEELFLIDKEVCPSETVADRIDVLAVDTDGRIVVVELKRGNNKLQLLQAIAYAGMISKWTAEDLITRAGPRADELREFVDQENLNRSQRIFLIAEAYDYEVLAGAEWLYEQYGVEIVCARVSLARDANTQGEYLTCTQIFPAKELAQHAIVRQGSRSPRQTSVADRDAVWDGRVTGMARPELREFIKAELASGRERDSLRLLYRVNGKRRYAVRPLVRQPYIYVRQIGHFPGEQEFWRERLSDPQSVAYRGDGALIFHLDNAADVTFFRSVLESDLPWGEAAQAATA